jgi:branched-subunit amino acid ABC-type transport system permease component
MGLVKRIQSLINSPTRTSFYAPFSMALALVFGIVKVNTFAHGEISMLGAYATGVIFSSCSGTISNWAIFFIAMIIAGVLVGAVGVIRAIIKLPSFQEYYLIEHWPGERLHSREGLCQSRVTRLHILRQGGRHA